MPMTYDELKALTVAELREIAKEHQDAIKGSSQMNKEHLLPALCKALGIPTHEHHDVVGIDKAGIKARMRELKKERVAAIAAHDPDRLRVARRQLHRLNHQLRAHTA
ncbi:MAG: hypothetical protein HYU53_17910 [Acidobacteria bacterium]|nr:hypothetical protein [Acidobacteriota bacterium]